MLNAGIVDENVDHAEGVLRFGYHFGDLARVEHVCRTVKGPDTEVAFDGGADGLDFIRVTQPVEHHVGALRCKGSGDTKSDAAGRAGDEGRATEMLFVGRYQISLLLLSLRWYLCVLLRGSIIAAWSLASPKGYA